MKKNFIYFGNCEKILKSFPKKSIDLIIADPPYNLSKGSILEFKNNKQQKGFGGNWTKIIESWDNKELIEYFLFTYNWIEKCKDVLKDTGSMWIHGTYHNIGIINFILQLLDIEIINEVIWYKRNSFPNLRGRRLTASHETILWCHTGKKKRKYFFNYDFSKKSFFKEDFLKFQNKQMRTVWDIPNNKSRDELAYGKHPTQKPERLIDRMIKLSSKKNNLMLCPFSGSGTECLVAYKNKLNFIGIENNKKYLNISKKRLKNYK
ncbi:site-specific DNA-methyltransferase [Candidatus Pelagibacter sp.]|nr:site-specific DNA-methyltransferase [Candidatus Pelagibacter sp.]